MLEHEFEAAADNGLWDYDDVPPPCAPGGVDSDTEVIIVDSQEEAGRRRGRKPMGTGKKDQKRIAKRKNVEVGGSVCSITRKRLLMCLL